MENLLTINSGNTSCSVGLYNNGLSKVTPLEELDKTIKEKASVVYTSEVGPVLDRWSGPKFVNLKSLINKNHLMAMPINYAETIGEDRLAGAYWIYKNIILQKKAKRILFVDAGTFTTLDLITEDGFEGGHIFLGTQSLLDSFSKGANLPKLIAGTESEIISLPKNTAEAIYGSVQMAERGLYEKWWERFRPEMIVLSGGMAFWHKKYLPSSIIEQAHIVHLGLYEAFKDDVH